MLFHSSTFGSTYMNCKSIKTQPGGRNREYILYLSLVPPPPFTIFAQPQHKSLYKYCNLIVKPSLKCCHLPQNQLLILFLVVASYKADETHHVRLFFFIEDFGNRLSRRHCRMKRNKSFYCRDPTTEQKIAHQLLVYSSSIFPTKKIILYIWKYLRE